VNPFGVQAPYFFDPSVSLVVIKFKSFQDFKFNRTRGARKVNKNIKKLSVPDFKNEVLYCSRSNIKWVSAAIIVLFFTP
jgi:hypothetical protein